MKIIAFKLDIWLTSAVPDLHNRRPNQFQIVFGLHPFFSPKMLINNFAQIQMNKKLSASFKGLDVINSLKVGLLIIYFYFAVYLYNIYVGPFLETYFCYDSQFFNL